MNHCLLEVEVLDAPQIRYTQDNQTPVAEMTVRFDALRLDDAPGQIKVVGWGSLAQDLQNRVQPGQRLVLEGRLRMNTVSRADGVKEKRAEFTLSRFHGIAGSEAASAPFGSTPIALGTSGAGNAGAGGDTGASAGGPSPGRRAAPAPARPAPGRSSAPSPSPTPARSARAEEPAAPVWNTSPLVADPEGFDEDDEIPF